MAHAELTIKTIVLAMLSIALLIVVGFLLWFFVLNYIPAVFNSLTMV